MHHPLRSRVTGTVPGHFFSRAEAREKKCPGTVRVITHLLLLGVLAGIAFADDESTPRSSLRPRELLALSRQLGESEENLRRFAGHAYVRADLLLDGWTPEMLERVALHEGTPEVFVLGAAALGADPDRAKACLDRLAELDDPRALPFLRAANHPGFRDLAARVPQSVSGSAAGQWLRLAEDIFEGRYPRGEASIRWSWSDGPVELALDAADRALAAAPDDLEVAAYRLRLEGARAVLEKAASDAGLGGGDLSASAPGAGADPAMLAAALIQAREDGEPIVWAWLLGLVGADADAGLVAETSRALDAGDREVREAALAASIRLQAGDALRGRSVADDTIRALLAGARTWTSPTARTVRSPPSTSPRSSGPRWSERFRRWPNW